MRRLGRMLSAFVLLASAPALAGRGDCIVASFQDHWGDISFHRPFDGSLRRGDGKLGGFYKGVAPDEITQINRIYDGSVALNGDISSIYFNAYYEKGFFRKAAVVIRKIAGGHLFDNGNKRTAHVVYHLLKERNLISIGASPDEVARIIDRVAEGALTEIEDIARELRQF